MSTNPDLVDWDYIYERNRRIWLGLDSSGKPINRSPSSAADSTLTYTPGTGSYNSNIFPQDQVAIQAYTDTDNLLGNNKSPGNMNNTEGEASSYGDGSYQEHVKNVDSSTGNTHDEDHEDFEDVVLQKFSVLSLIGALIKSVFNTKK